MKTMCPSGFHHNGFVGQIAYGYNCWCNKLIYIYIYICIYIYIYIALLFLTLVLQDRINTINPLHTKRVREKSIKLF